jgi:LuxR family maltose regulon positive regulatory protein
MLKNDLLANKFLVPQHRTGLVPRPKVTKLLEQGVWQTLTLISAPAGSGKTTSLSSWLRAAEVRAAWLSLDHYDNDLYRFWTYVLAALDKLLPGTLKSTQEVLNIARTRLSHPIEEALTALINDLVDLTDDIVLVLDDYHEITTTTVQTSLAFFLDHLPPQVHLIIATRNDPPLSLARLRISNQLTEIRAGDLRFSFEESTLFLKSVMELDLTSAEIAVLETRTEGWIAGLQLAALSIQRRPNRASFLAAFAGNHHYIVNYLAEEVLQKQPEQVQQFLLHTSLLDRLNPSLCHEVTGDTESSARLAHLERANLFLVALDDTHAWYRYHQLFADFLRMRLQQSEPDLVDRLHRRAASWYQRNGHYEEAMNHLLQARDFPGAISLIELNGQEMMRRGDFALLDRWISALPDTLVRNNPRVILIHASVLPFLHQSETAERRLVQLEASLNASEDKPDNQEGIKAEILSVRAFIEVLRLNFPQAIVLSRRALDSLAIDNVFMRSITALCLGIAFRESDRPAAQAALEQAIYEANSPHISLLSLEHFGYHLQEQGQLHRALELYQQALRVLPDGQTIPAQWMAYAGIAEVQREWNNLESAERAIFQALELNGSEIMRVDLNVLLARIKQAQGRTDDALAFLRQEENVGHQKQFAPAIHLMRAYQALFEVWRGNPEAAQLWMRDFEQRTLSYPLTMRSEREYCILARVQLALGMFAEAESLLKRILAQTKAEGRTRATIKIIVLQALALQAKGAAEEALDMIIQALTLAEPEEYLLTFIEEGADMMRLLNRVRSARRTGATTPRVSPEYLKRLLEISGEPLSDAKAILSERELEILRLIADGLSNQEIAGRLVIALSTVKWHVRQIFNKLNANSRTQVLAQARELSLL